MNSGSGFIAYLPSFHFGEPALLISVDTEALNWLISRFEELASAPFGIVGFVIGDGNPIESDGRCLVGVRVDRRKKSTRLARVSLDRFDWIVSQRSVQHFRELLFALLKSQTAAHQYLDSDDRLSPVVIVSKGEYGTDTIRSWLQP